MSHLNKLSNLIKKIKMLYEQKYNGWIKLYFHRGDLSKKIEHGGFEDLE